MAFLDQNPGLGFPAAAAFGLALGSFLNVVILRLPRRLEWQWQRDSREILGEPEAYDPPPPGIVVEPSHCPHCKHRLSLVREHPARQLADPARQVPPLPRADLDAVPVRRIR